MFRWNVFNMGCICTQRTHPFIHSIHVHLYISTCIYTYVYIHIHKHIHLYTYIYIYMHIQSTTYIYTYIYTHIQAYLYILRRNKQTNGTKKRVQSINTYIMTFIGNNRHLYMIILANRYGSRDRSMEGNMNITMFWYFYYVTSSNARVWTAMQTVI